VHHADFHGEDACTRKRWESGKEVKKEEKRKRKNRAFTVTIP